MYTDIRKIESKWHLCFWKDILDSTSFLGSTMISKKEAKRLFEIGVPSKELFSYERGITRKSPLTGKTNVMEDEGCEKKFKIVDAETRTKLEEFTLTEANDELRVDEEWFPVAERSPQEQQVVAEFRVFIESAEVGETLTTEHSTYGKVIYQRVS